MEEAQLRPSEVREGRCQDYVQLGRDDATPFFTWDKTPELCGVAAEGVTYDVPEGKLLLWVRLGSAAGLETAGLGLVVTTYLREESTHSLTHYRACSTGGRFIRRGFFCDGRVNCAADSAPADESPKSCGGEQEQDSALPIPAHFNIVTITLVLASSTVLLLALALLAIRLGRHPCCLRSPPSPELPDRAAPVRRPQARPHTLLHTSRAPPVVAVVEGRGTTPDSGDEPPPAYRDLFPVPEEQEKEVIGIQNQP